VTRGVWRFGALALIVLATSLWAGGRLRRLQAVRAERAALAAVPETRLALRDPGPGIRAAVRGGGVTLIRLTAARAGGVAAAELVLSGPELAVRRTIARIEAGARFAGWRMTPEPGSADRVRFAAVAYALPGAGR